MKAKPEIREKRIKEINQLYELIIKDNDNYKEDLYNILKETFNKQKVIDSIYAHLEKILSLILKEIKKIYKDYDKEKIIDLVDLLYDEDGKSLDERISQWFDKFDEEHLMSLFYHLCLIIDTESFRLVPEVIEEKTDAEYVEIISDGCDNCSGSCEEWADGNVYHEDDIELPPYHPNCCCEAIFYKEDEVEEDIIDERNNI